jgi:hypothetical protein
MKEQGKCQGVPRTRIPAAKSSRQDALPSHLAGERPVLGLILRDRRCFYCSQFSPFTSAPSLIWRHDFSVWRLETLTLVCHTHVKAFGCLGSHFDSPLAFRSLPCRESLLRRVCPVRSSGRFCGEDDEGSSPLSKVRTLHVPNSRLRCSLGSRCWHSHSTAATGSPAALQQALDLAQLKHAQCWKQRISLQPKAPATVILSDRLSSLVPGPLVNHGAWHDHWERNQVKT